jgi:hypothetical protein
MTCPWLRRIAVMTAIASCAAAFGVASSPAEAKVSVDIHIGPPGYYVPYYHPPAYPPYAYPPRGYGPYPYGPYYLPRPYGPYYRYYRQPYYVPYYERHEYRYR